MRKASIFLFVLTVFLAFTTTASAFLIFDRGLPTANLNNAAGSSRSNVAWAFGPDTSGYWVAGDDFSISGSGTYHVDTISVWAMMYNNQPLSATTLWFGAENGALSNIGPAAAVVDASYAGGIDYQGSSGSFIKFSRLDFAVNQDISAGTTYQFFLDNAFLVSSNAALSGSTQQGADDYMRALWVNGPDLTVESWQSLGSGWDKNSDANVQVYGAPVPVPAAVWLLGTGLAGLACIRRRFQK